MRASAFLFAICLVQGAVGGADECKSQSCCISEREDVIKYGVSFQFEATCPSLKCNPSKFFEPKFFEKYLETLFVGRPDETTRKRKCRCFRKLGKKRRNPCSRSPAPQAVHNAAPKSVGIDTLRP